MISQNRKFKNVLTVAIIASILLFPSISYSIDKDQALNEYLIQKGLCNYAAAIDVLEEWTVKSSDPAEIETNIFRIDEIIKYPELIDSGVLALSRIRGKNQLVKETPFLLARIDFFLIELYMRQGKRERAEGIRDSLGFIKRFKIVGPFRSGSQGEFEIHNPPEDGYRSGAVYAGKIHNVSWFNAGCGLSGMIDLNDLFKEVDDSAFYLQCELAVPEDGEYILSLGKTGFADILLDGRKIFTSRKRHTFSFDQYRIRVKLSKGVHIALLKSDGSRDGGLKASLRITDSSGNPVESGGGILPANSTAGEFIESVYFEALNIIISSSFDKLDSFTAGYLFYISGLNSEEEREAYGFFSTAGKNEALAGSAEYYMGLLEPEDEKKDTHFYKSIINNPKNIEAVAETAGIKIKNKFIYEASPVVESIIKIKPLSIEYLISKGRILSSLGWRDEAMKTAGILINSEFPSAGYTLEADLNMHDKRYKEALRGYLYLYAGSRSNLSLADNIISCYEELGDHKSAEKILCGALLMFPNSVRLRLKFAELKSNYYTAGESLPYLASASGLSPYNSEVLFDTGMTYHKLGRKDLAVDYLRRALNHDPDNFELKRFLEIITNEINETLEYLIRDDPQRLSDAAVAYRDEPAVILLNETAFRVMQDGSYEKSVHQVIEINEQNAAKDFSTQYVVINPDTDRVEDFRCAVLSSGGRVETSEAGRQSLSEPESRLYYDLQASVITLPSIEKGSIVDVRYTVKNSGGTIYKNYFGEKITAGGEYRIMISNTVISFPEEKRIYYHLKNIGAECGKSFSSGRKKLYRVLIKDIPPYKAESAMPDYAEIAPSIYFSSLKDWDELYRWYSGLIRGKIKLSEEMMMTLREIIKPDDSEMDRVGKIYNHVTRLIRYVGFEFGVGGIQPRSSELTYHTRMGDCKDISLVLIAMLREAGIDAKLALLRVRDEGEANLAVPFLGEFNHAICYVNARGGFFIDGTAKMGGFREFPGQDCGVKAFVLDESGYSFINTDTGFYLENSESEMTDVVIDEKGQASLKRTIIKKGNLADSLRSASMDSGVWIQSIREYWNRKFPGSRINDLRLISSGLDEPVSYSYTIDIPFFINMDGDDMILSSFILTSDYYKNYAMLKSRKYPISLLQKYSVESVIRYAVPEGFEVYKMPESESCNNRKFSAVFKFSKSVDGRHVEVRSVIQFKDYRIETGEYSGFREFTRMIEKKENEKIIFVRSGGKE